MSTPEEPKVKHIRVPVKDNFWDQDQVSGYRRISSGPPPTFDELPPLDGTGEETTVEGSEKVEESKDSPSFPGTPRQLPLKQKGVDLEK